MRWAPLVAGPLRRTDCSLVSDGAAALVLADVETALALEKAVVFRATEHDVRRATGLQPKSIFQIAGPGAVGVGSATVSTVTSQPASTKYGRLTRTRCMSGALTGGKCGLIMRTRLVTGIRRGGAA